jgi:hypothetical protein
MPALTPAEAVILMHGHDVARICRPEPLDHLRRVNMTSQFLGSSYRGTPIMNAGPRR